MTSAIERTAALSPKPEKKSGKARPVGRGNLGMMDVGAWLKDHGRAYHEKIPRDKDKEHLVFFVLEDG